MINEEMIKMVERTLDQLNSYYPPGLYDWMYVNNKSDYDNLIKIENNIDELLINNGSEEHLRVLLMEFWKLHKKNIELFSNGHNRNEGYQSDNYNLQHVRTERLQERNAI